MSTVKKHTKTHSTYAFESNTNSVAASQMRNALNKLADSVTDDDARVRLESELDSFFSLFRRYLAEKSSGNTLDWDKIRSPSQEEVVDYKVVESSQAENVSNLDKLAVLKLNGGLGTSMGLSLIHI